MVELTGIREMTVDGPVDAVVDGLVRLGRGTIRVRPETDPSKPRARLTFDSQALGHLLHPALDLDTLGDLIAPCVTTSESPPATWRCSAMTVALRMPGVDRDGQHDGDGALAPECVTLRLDDGYDLPTLRQLRDTAGWDRLRLQIADRIAQTGLRRVPEGSVCSGGWADPIVDLDGEHGSSNHPPAPVRSYLTKVHQDLSRLDAGQRSNRFWAASVALGGLVGSGTLTEEEAWRTLTAAAAACGFTMPADGDTIRRGLSHGRSQPWRLGGDDRDAARHPGR